MCLKTLPITVLFCLFLNAIGKTLELTCYECSRGSAEGKDQLIDRYFYLDNDESAKRAILHESEDCGSNTTILDRTYRAYCPRLCQITYLLHDPNLTVIASCQSGGWNGSIEKNEYVLDTCGTDLCNNLALNQDNSTMPDDSFAAHKTINETMLLFLFVLSRL